MMDRRDFLKLAAATGAVVTGPAAYAFSDGFDAGVDPSLAVEDPYFFVQVQAVGGWEPTMLCDPKGNLNRTYGEGDILTAGAIPYAPLGEQWDTFFGENYHRMTVINGVDGQTNSHDPGRRHTASGRLGEGYPVLAAMAAAHQGPHLPIAFLTFGGYEMTSGVIAPTRDVDADRLAGIAYPARINPDNTESADYHYESTQGLIAAARNARLETQVANMHLPHRKGRLDTLMTARLGSDQLKQLEELLPVLNGTGEENRIRLAVAAFRAGIGSAANFSRGGFDTHGNHDAAHRTRMGDLLNLMNMIMREVEDAGIADKTIMLVSSDFGRTPGYNGNNGKDHWPITSMIVVGEALEGNRVIGTTDENHRAIPVDPNTLQPSDSGVRIEPQHVHRNIRDVLGMRGTAIDQMFPITPQTDLKLL
jgi:hypothetical protein